MDTSERAAFTRTLRPGAMNEPMYNRFSGDVCAFGLPISIEIKWTGDRLSLTGDIGRESMGQVQDTLVSSLDNITYAEGWNADRLRMLCVLWRRWHLNDMQAGTVEQMDVLRQVWDDFDHTDHYAACLAVLEQCGLLTVTLEDGTLYTYGHRWLMEEVPTAVLRILRGLPTGGPVKARLPRERVMSGR